MNGLSRRKLKLSRMIDELSGASASTPNATADPHDQNAYGAQEELPSEKATDTQVGGLIFLRDNLSA